MRLPVSIALVTFLTACAESRGVRYETFEPTIIRASKEISECLVNDCSKVEIAKSISSDALRMCARDAVLYGRLVHVSQTRYQGFASVVSALQYSHQTSKCDDVFFIAYVQLSDQSLKNAIIDLAIY
jgi:hypothetical protein